MIRPTRINELGALDHRSAAMSERKPYQRVVDAEMHPRLGPRAGAARRAFVHGQRFATARQQATNWKRRFTRQSASGTSSSSGSMLTSRHSARLLDEASGTRFGRIRRGG